MSYIDDLFDGVFGKVNVVKGGSVFTSLANFKATEDEYELRFRAAGLGKSDIQISADNGNLVVKSTKPRSEEQLVIREFWEDRIDRTIELPKDCDCSNIKAETRDGILYIRIPRVKNEEKFIKID